MNRLISYSLTSLIFFFLLVATSRNAFGYVDPGSGLLALQTFGSVMAAAGFFLRKRFKGMLGMKTAQAETASTASKTDSPNAA